MKSWNTTILVFSLFMFSLNIILVAINLAINSLTKEIKKIREILENKK